MKLVYRATLEGGQVHWEEGEHPDPALRSVPVTVLVHASGGTERSKSLIIRTPNVSGGDACFAGYRIPVWLIVEAWQQGWTDDEVMAAHPVLHRDHLTAAREYYREHRREIDLRIAENAAA